MVGKGVYRDSIGACDLYSNPYDVRAQSHPAIVKQRMEGYAQEKDTLDSSANYRLQREIFLRVQQGELPLSLGKFIVLVQVGKYLFLAIALPPYIFLYGIPKWFFLKVLPKLYRLNTKMLGRIADKISRATEKSINFFSLMGKKIASPFLVFAEKTKKAFSYLKEKTTNLFTFPFRFMSKRALKPFVELFSGVQHFLEKFVEFGKSFRAILQTVQERAKELFIRLPESMRQKEKELVSKAKESFFTLMPYLKRPFLGLYKKVKNVWEAVQRKTASAKKRIEKLSNAIREAAVSIKDKFLESAKAVSQPFVDWVRPKLEGLKRALEKGVRYKDLAVEKVKEKGKEFLERIERVQKSVVETMQQMVAYIPLPPFSLFASALAFTIRPFDYRKVSRKSSRFIKKVKEKINSGLNRFFQRVQKAKKRATKKVKRYLAKLFLFVLKGAHWLKKLLLIALTAFKGAFLIFILTFAWAIALFRLGARLLAQTASTLLSSRSS